MMANNMNNRQRFNMRQTFGFELSDFQSWPAFCRWICQPLHPANLAVLRATFGLLMTIDVFTERAFPHVNVRWGIPDECQFPLFDFLKPLPLPWMYVLYLTLLIGALGIMFGLFYKLSCLLYVCAYWYIFLLDKTSWNNHTYLYGLISFQLLFMDANRAWSLDGLIWKKIRNTHVPGWNYGLLRFQIILVYFFAGIKKLDSDWVAGYSMEKLSEHWVFEPFTLMLGREYTDLLVVHLGGLMLDISVGFLLYFDQTRIFAFTFGGMFHVINSRLFSIGMFPYTMLATMPLFSAPDWPMKIVRKLPQIFRVLAPRDEVVQSNPHCIYPQSQPDNRGDAATRNSHPQFYHKIRVIFILCYVVLQCFLPFSHSITKGYNNWTNGLYGYSWDMMVHTWRTQHTRVSYLNKDTGEMGFLNPDAWINRRTRWTSHADMVKQYANCVKERLVDFNLTNVELYVDVWKSMNKRFQQRMFDPRVNIIEAEWHPLKQTPWLFPLLTDLSDWREKLRVISSELSKESDNTEMVFVADFPGLYLENFIQEDLGNTSLTVLKGEVLVELMNMKQNVTLSEGDTLKVPAGEFHNIHTVSETPSCYMYAYVNTTHVEFDKNFTEFRKKVNESTENGTKALTDPTLLNDDLFRYYKHYQERTKWNEQKMSITSFQKFRHRLANFISGVHHSLHLTKIAITSIYTGEPMASIMDKVNTSKELEAWKVKVQSFLGVEVVEVMYERPVAEESV